MQFGLACPFVLERLFTALNRPPACLALFDTEGVRVEFFTRQGNIFFEAEFFGRFPLQGIQVPNGSQFVVVFLWPTVVHLNVYDWPVGGKYAHFC